MEIQLPAIPDKRYFTIGEVSELCGVKPHVLRYWEQEFAQLRPVKRRGNRRYYQHHEVLLIRRIRDLLYEQGFTISGARNRLAELGPAAIRALADSHDDEVDDSGGAPGMLRLPVAPLTMSSPVSNPPRPPVIDVPTPQVARDALVRSGARSLRDELLAIRALLHDEGMEGGVGK
jgi:DNA-binding transcriptional MerR regulator